MSARGLRYWLREPAVVLVALALLLGALVGLVAVVEAQLEERDRDASCAAIGEEWVAGHHEGDSWVPGQCGEVFRA